MNDKNTANHASIQLQANIDLEVLKAGREDARVMMRVSTDFALLTIKSLILLNGGACIGVLTYLGSISKNLSGNAVLNSSSATWGIGWFSIGLFFGTLSSGVAYVAQIFFNELDQTNGRSSPAVRWGNGVRYFAVFCAFLSLFAFIFGAWFSLGVFRAPFAPG